MQHSPNTPSQMAKEKGVLKRFLPQTLLGRSLLILITPIFVTQIVLTFIFFDRHWSKMTSRLAYAVAGEVAVLSFHLEEGDDDGFVTMSALAEKHLDMLVTYDPDEAIEPLVASGRYFDGWEGTIERTLMNELSSLLSRPFTVDVDFNEKWVEIRVQHESGVLNVVLPQRRLFSSTTYIFLLWTFGVSIALLAIAVLFMRNQIRPIHRLARAAEHFGKGRDVDVFKIEGAYEVRQAGQAFLDMKTRIQRQVSQRMDMLAGVSHDLRTPLTRLKLQLAMLGDGPDVADMKKDISDMERMIEGYLNFVRGDGNEEAVIIDLCALLKDVTRSGKRQEYDVNLTMDDNLTTVARPLALKRCLGNLVNNAGKYANRIWVSARRSDEHHVTIMIEDDGPGIDPQLHDSVFQPFYRIDESRNTQTGGVGLGLPIAMDIIHAHGGDIWLDKSKHGGLSVLIEIPV